MFVLVQIVKSGLNSTNKTCLEMQCTRTMLKYIRDNERGLKAGEKYVSLDKRDLDKVKGDITQEDFGEEIPSSSNFASYSLSG